MYPSTDINEPPGYYPNPPPTYPGNDMRVAPIMARPFMTDPLQVMCPNCRQQVVTKVVPEIGPCAGLAAVIVFLFCCPCFWIPLVIDSCKDFQHICPSCNAVVGVYKKL